MQETQETQVQPLGQEDFLEEGMVTHSSILAWRMILKKTSFLPSAPVFLFINLDK